MLTWYIPSGPGVNVANGGLDTIFGEDLSDLANVAHNGIGALTGVGAVCDASGRDTVQILGADRDTSNEVGEAGAVL